MNFVQLCFPLLLGYYFATTTRVVAAARDALMVSEGGTGSACTAQDPCGSIQQAIDLVAEGGKIAVGAGTFAENLSISGNKTGIIIEGVSSTDTIVQSAGGNDGQMAPPNVPVDIILDIFSPNVKISKLGMVHPSTTAVKRDVGVFVRPPATDVVLDQIRVERLRTGADLEPFTPGSRGLLVLRATGV